MGDMNVNLTPAQQARVNELKSQGLSEEEARAQLNAELGAINGNPEFEGDVAPKAQERSLSFKNTFEYCGLSQPARDIVDDGVVSAGESNKADQEVLNEIAKFINSIQDQESNNYRQVSTTNLKESLVVLDEISLSDRVDKIAYNNLVKEEQNEQNQSRARAEEAYNADHAKDEGWSIGKILGAVALGVGAIALGKYAKGKVGKLLPAILGAGAIGLGTTSCNDTNIKQEVTIVDKHSAMSEIIAALDKLGGNLQKILEELQAMKFDLSSDLKTIITILQTLGFSVDQIKDVLVQNGVSLDKIEELLSDINNKLDGLMDAVMQNNAISQEIKDILNNIKNQVGDLSNITGDNNTLLKEILNQLNNIQQGDTAKMEALQAILAKLEVLIQKGDQLDENDKKTQELLGKILNAINQLDGDLKVGVLAILKKMDKMDTNNLEMLTKILEKIEQGGNDKDYTDILNAILAKLNESVDNNNQMKEEIRALLNSILDNIQNFNADFKAAIKAILTKLDQMDEKQSKFFKEILEKMDKMDEQDQKFYAAVLAKLDQLSAGQIVALEKLLKAIENGNKIAKGTYEVVLKILDQIGNLGEKADKILEVLANIGSGVNVSLDEIKQLLADIKAEQQNGNQILTDIDSKIGMMLVVVNGMKDEFGGKLDTIIEKLEGLLGKECNHDQLIEILMEIKVIIQENGNNNNNEGILDDLEDLLG